MSSILQALERAESERRARSSPVEVTLAPQAPAARSRPVIWAWLLLGGLTGAALGTGLLLWWRPALVFPSAAVMAPVREPAAMVPPTPTPALMPSPAQAPKATAPTATVPSATQPAQVTASRTTARPTERTASPSKIDGRTAQAGVPNATTPTPLGEWPADLRSQVPALTIGGSVHADTPAARLLIVNGQVAREGDTPAPEVRLESIGPNAAVFEFRGRRFSMPL